MSSGYDTPVVSVWDASTGELHREYPGILARMMPYRSTL